MVVYFQTKLRMQRIFLSYSHDSEVHKKRVHSLVRRLSSDGFKVVIDQDRLPGGPAEGWPLWSQAQVRDADKVLVVCTEWYCKRYEGLEAHGTGLGSVCEARAIRQLLFEAGGVNEKFRVITFARTDDSFVPLDLRAYHRYCLGFSKAYEQLLAWLTGGASTEIPSLGSNTLIEWPAQPASYRSILADRQAILSSFHETISGLKTQRALLLSGAANTGKTSIVAALHEHAADLGVLSVLFDLKGCISLVDLFESLRLELGQKLPDAPRRRRSIQELLFDLRKLAQPIVLLFDSFEQASANAQKWIAGEFLLRLTSTPALIAVIAGRRVPECGKHAWRNVGEHFKLEHIHDAAVWLEYLERKFNPQVLTREHVEALMFVTKGNPGHLSALLDAMVKRSHNCAGTAC